MTPIQLKVLSSFILRLWVTWGCDLVWIGLSLVLYVGGWGRNTPEKMPASNRSDEKSATMNRAPEGGVEYSLFKFQNGPYSLFKFQTKSLFKFQNFHIPYSNFNFFHIFYFQISGGIKNQTIH